MVRVGNGVGGGAKRTEAERQADKAAMDRYHREPLKLDKPWVAGNGSPTITAQVNARAAFATANPGRSLTDKQKMRFDDALTAHMAKTFPVGTTTTRGQLQAAAEAFGHSYKPSYGP